MAVAAATTWAHLWRDCVILFWIDDQSDMYVANKGDAKNPIVLDLLKTLAMLSYNFHFKYTMKYTSNPRKM